MSSIRRKRRRRGKLRVERRKLREEALKTWEALNSKPKPKPESIIIPLIRNVMPNVIAQDLVGVQPMMIGDATPGIEPVHNFNVRYSDEVEEKQTPYQRKKQRKLEKQQRRRMEKALERIKAKNGLY